MHWWQWVLQVTGTWFYVALGAGCVWSVVRRAERRREAAKALHHREKAFHRHAA
jgi:hypothetical protein